MLTKLTACVTTNWYKMSLYFRRRISTAANVKMPWTFTSSAGFEGSKFHGLQQPKAGNPYSSIPGQYMSTKCHWDRLLSQYFGFPSQYHSTDAPYSFIHLPPTLCNLSNWQRC